MATRSQRAEEVFRSHAPLGIEQDPFLFSRTLAENIAMGRDGRDGNRSGRDGGSGATGDGTADDEQVRQSAELAGLAGDVASFAEGYGQLIGERGITLSGGQKQRTAIARALMKASPVVILDDALSSVDARTESAIIENLTALRGTRTLIVVSHRISPLKGADRILVLGRGEIRAEVARPHFDREQLLRAALAEGTPWLPPPSPSPSPRA